MNHSQYTARLVLWTKTIQGLWDNEFFVAPGEKRYLDIVEDKQEIINDFVNKLLFCDKYKPKVTSFKDMDTLAVGKIQYMDRMRLLIYNDVKKTPYETEIEQKYVSNLPFHS